MPTSGLMPLQRSDVMRGNPERRKWIVLAILFCMAALNYADRTAVTAVFPLLRRDLGMSDVALAATGSFFLWSYAAASPFAGYLGDLVSRARLLTITLGLWSVVMTCADSQGRRVNC